MSKTKLYVVSSTEFKSLKEAENKLNKWNDAKELDIGAKVYRVNKIFDVATNLTLVERKRGKPRKHGKSK